MNKRIKELGIEAGMYVDLDGKPWPKWMSAAECEAAYEKFAKLLIADVLSYLDNERIGYVAEGKYTYMSEEWYDRMAASEEALADAIRDLKNRYEVD